MAIYLDEQTRPYLERLIGKQIEKSEKDFVARRIMGSLESDRNRLDRIAICEHDFGEYIGKKQCCTKCGHYDVGMGENWDLIPDLAGEVRQSSPLPPSHSIAEATPQP